MNYIRIKGMLARIDNHTLKMSTQTFISYHNDEGFYHRDDGPAIENEVGDKYWYVNGKLHRIDGFAVEKIHGKKEKYINGSKVI